MRLFHLVSASAWADVVRTGQNYAPASLAAEGFVHFSFAEQVAGTANRYYREVTDLVVLEIDPDRLVDPVEIEDSTGSGTAFPHVYAAIPLDAVTDIHPLRRDASGAYDYAPGAQP
jgi:uncharacterized protein (DUF952 family)